MQQPASPIAIEGSLAMRLARHWAELARLAWPVMLSRAGLLTLTLVDIVMVGRFGTGALAHMAMGYSVFVPIMVTGIGAMVGIIAIVSQRWGAGDRTGAAEAFGQGLRWALIVGAAASLVIALGEPFLRLIGHDPGLVAGGGLIARWLAPGALLQVLFVACSFYLESTRRVLPGLVYMAAANLANLALNAWLIGGGWGLPALGAEGAAIASVLARVVMTAGILIHVLMLPEMRRARGRHRAAGGWAAGRGLRRIGHAGAAAMFFETMAFAALNQVAAFISPEALAAYSIAHQVEAMVFMVALGLSVATAVRVGNAWGAGLAAEARFAAWSGLAATMLTVAACSGLIVAGAGRLGSLFSEDPGLVARTAPLFVILAVSLIFDGGQAVMGQVNRALGDSWGTTACFFIAFWLVMVPLGLVLGLHTRLEEAGLFLATACGTFAAVILLSWRFARLSRRRGAA